MDYSKEHISTQPYNLSHVQYISHVISAKMSREEQINHPLAETQ